MCQFRPEPAWAELSQLESVAPREHSRNKAETRAYTSPMTDLDPVVSNPDHYRMLWENEHVRVLEYTDVPGDETTEHHHPNSVMVTLSDFQRQLRQGERTADVELAAGQVLWLPEQEHSGRNTGDS